MKGSKAASLLCILALSLLVLSASIAAPILIRPFYYAHIQALDLPGSTGWSAETIREAYDQVLDFCVFGKPFGTGELAWSDAGRDHFADVRQLFLADFAVLILSGLACLILLILNRRSGLRFYPFGGRRPFFWAGLLPALIVGAAGALAALDFDRAFVVFHALFFPGKDNWLFDPRTDQIILVMPQIFFRNCALLIGGLLLACCLLLVLAGRRRVKPPAPSSEAGALLP